MKEKTFKFEDGIKTVKVGDIVHMVGSERRDKPRNMYVIKVGRDLIRVAYEPTSTNYYTEFYMETGKQKTNYQGSRLYSSEESYIEAVKQYRMIESVNAFFRDSWKNKITYDQALKIREVLGITGE